MTMRGAMFRRIVGMTGGIFVFYHRGHREHRDSFKIKKLCALCVPCGLNFLCPIIAFPVKTGVFNALLLKEYRLRGKSKRAHFLTFAVASIVFMSFAVLA